LNLGAGGTATFSGTFAPNLFRVGQPFNPDAQPLAGPGTYTQSGAASSLTVTQFLHIGEGHAGEFNLIDGSVTNNNDFFQVGWNNMGTLNQNGGSIATRWMSVGTVPTGNGTVNMTAGSIDVNVGLRIGAEGAGLFDMSSGNGMVTAGFIAVSDLPVSSGEMRVGDQSQVILDNNDRFVIGWGRNTTTGAQANGTLTMTGGSITLQTTGGGPVADMVVAWGGVGQLDLSDGTIDVGNSVVTAIDGADGAAARSQATINHSGGTLNAVRMILSERGETDYNLSGSGAVNLTEDLSLGRFNPASGVPSIGRVTQTGGAMNVGRNMFIANGADGGAGVYEISGGALDVDSDLVVGLFSGDGRLNVIGADGQVTVGNDYFQDPTATLFVQPDALGQLTTIDVGNNALFWSGTTVEANFNNYPGYGLGEFWNVLTAATIDDQGLNVVAPAGIEWHIIPGGNGEILQLYAIPEPTSLVLAIIAGLALFGPRRQIR
jgi:hypothetical protein